MKKLLLLLSCFCATSLFGYTWNIYNNTGGKISVALDAIGRPDYTKELADQENWPLDTIGWCIRGIKVNGKTGPVKGKFAQEQVPGISCRGYNVTILGDELYQSVDPLSGLEEIRAKNLKIEFGIA